MAFLVTGILCELTSIAVALWIIDKRLSRIADSLAKPDSGAEGEGKNG